MSQIDLLKGQLAKNGFVICPKEPAVQDWAKAVYDAGLHAAQDPALQAEWLRHDGTWFVGVDALPTGPDGACDGVPLGGMWLDLVSPPKRWHRAQVSVTYAGYPKQGPEDTEAAHRYRVRRFSAHVDGLRLEAGRRYPREPHAFVVGFALNSTKACPLMVWPGSHLRIQSALARVIGANDPREVDVTDAYVTARAEVLELIEPQPVYAEPGQAVVVHRHCVHGIAPHDPDVAMPDEGRMMAYFRPECENPKDWIGS